MVNFLAFLAISALGANALALPQDLVGNGDINTQLTVATWAGANCNGHKDQTEVWNGPMSTPVGSVFLSYMVSRSLAAGESLDMSFDAAGGPADPSDKDNKCGMFVEKTNPMTTGATLVANHCYQLMNGRGAHCVHLH